MQVSESLEEKLLLGWRGESKSLNGLGSMTGSSLDCLSREAKSSVGVLDHSVSIVVLLVVNSKLVLSSESFSGLGGSSVDGKANTVSSSPSSGFVVMKTSQVEWISGEALFSGFASLHLSLESTLIFGQSP